MGEKKGAVGITVVGGGPIERRGDRARAGRGSSSSEAAGNKAGGGLGGVEVGKEVGIEQVVDKVKSKLKRRAES